MKVKSFCVLKKDKNNDIMSFGRGDSMQEKKSAIKKPMYLYVVSGICIGVLSLILKSIVSLACWVNYTGETPLLGEMENFVIWIISFIGSLMVYNSIAGLIICYDRSSADEFFAGEANYKDIRLSFKKIFCYRSFIVEAVSATGVIAIAALLGASPEIAGMFYSGEGKSPYSSGIVPMLASVFIFALLIMNGRYETVRYWCGLRRRMELDELKNKTKLFIRIAIIFVLYPIFIPFMPIFFFALSTIVSVIVALADVLSWGGLISITVLLFSSIKALKILIAVKKRKKFIKNMKSTLGVGRYTISEIENPYRSLIFLKYKCRFSLEYKDKRYECVVLSSPRYRVPIYFNSETEAAYCYRLGTKRHNITLWRNFDYSIEDAEDSAKIIIISPTPKDVLISDGFKERRIFNADRLWDYVLYDADAFIGAADRECLGRSEIFRT